MKIRYLVRTLSKKPCDVPDCTRPGCEKTEITYALPSGEVVERPQPGDVFIGGEHEPTPEAARAYGCPWDNCDGKHLYCLLPTDAHPWNIDGRASNCTMPEDRLHRCWVRHGDAAAGTLHVDKNGRTCSAGAGSIAVPGYHGFLHNGELTP